MKILDQSWSISQSSQISWWFVSSLGAFSRTTNSPTLPVRGLAQGTKSACPSWGRPLTGKAVPTKPESNTICLRCRDIVIICYHDSIIVHTKRAIADAMINVACTLWALQSHYNHRWFWWRWCGLKLHQLRGGSEDHHEGTFISILSMSWSLLRWPFEDCFVICGCLCRYNCWWSARTEANLNKNIGKPCDRHTCKHHIDIMVQDKRNKARNNTTEVGGCIHAFLVTHTQNQEVLSQLVSNSKNLLLVSLVTMVTFKNMKSDPVESRWFWYILIQDLQNSAEFQDLIVIFFPSEFLNASLVSSFCKLRLPQDLQGAPEVSGEVASESQVALATIKQNMDQISTNE